MNTVLLAGKFTLFRKRNSTTRQYELTPRQIRRLFEERGWARVLGFHTRNVVHRGHEFVQLKALEEEGCDGLFVHPVVGRKKTGDFNASIIIKSHETMIERVYPKGRVVFCTFSTFSRYAGPREAVFTALCRKNFGCSHFIVGRSHTSVDGYDDARASQEIFERFPDLDIKAVKCNEVFYSRKRRGYVVHQDGENGNDVTDRLRISGSEARRMLEKGEAPPTWFMRPEISQLILDAKKRGERVFV